MAQRIIGLAGRKRSGKDTLCKLLQVHGPYQRLAFADAVWDVLEAADPYIDIVQGWRLSHFVNTMGRERTKEMWPEVRRLLQKLGTEGVRDHIGESVWRDVVKNKILAAPHNDFIVTDVRFLDEASMLQDMGGFIVKIERPGYADDDASGSLHKSELDVAKIQEDLLIRNEDDLHWLADQSIDVHQFRRR